MSTAKRTLLIIEDDSGLQSQMRWCFDQENVALAGTQEEAQQQIASAQPEVVTLDLGIPPDPGGTSAGFELLTKIREDLPHTKVIVVTGREEQEHAINAIALGAYDYYNKPVDANTLKLVVERAFKLHELEQKYRDLQSIEKTETPLPGLIASSPAMLTLVKQVERVAPTQATVLIAGETGTGKEVIAQALHQLSPRSDEALITINCAAIPENLLESELFGHEKGSFTGAHARKIGKVEAADGGTLFLDEIGDMPLPLQAKILRFLQERTFERVGSTKSQQANVRVISATHRPLEEGLENSTFREDLYYRLSEIRLDLPALRDRGSDVLLIARHLLNQNQGDRKLRFALDAVDAIQAWHWPGNVRELENKIRRAAIMADENAIQATDLELTNESTTGQSKVGSKDGSRDGMNTGPIRNLKEARAVAETQAIQRALAISDGNMTETAKLLDVSRPTLYSLVEKLNISVHHTED